MSTSRLDGHRCLVIDRLRLTMLIGILEREKREPQEVVVTIRMFIPEAGRARSTDIGHYVSYADVVEGVRAIATFHPRWLLQRPSDKALAWRDLLLLMSEEG